MQYVYYAQTPPSTSSKNPLVTTCALSYGYITSMLVVFPKGCAGLVGLQLYKASELFFPFNSNAWLIGDDLKENFGMLFPMLDENFNVQIATYNNDTLYSHTPYVVFTVEVPPSSPDTSMPTSAGGNYSSGDQSQLPSDGGNGGTTTPSYTCPDGTVVDDPSKCPQTPSNGDKKKTPIQPITYKPSQLAGVCVILL